MVPHAGSHVSAVYRSVDLELECHFHLNHLPRAQALAASSSAPALGTPALRAMALGTPAERADMVRLQAEGTAEAGGSLACLQAGVLARFAGN